MTPTADDRGGVTCVNPPEGGFFVASGAGSARTDKSSGNIPTAISVHRVSSRVRLRGAVTISEAEGAMDGAETKRQPLKDAT
jgi:hypothetical protein